MYSDVRNLHKKSDLCPVSFFFPTLHKSTKSHNNLQMQGNVYKGVSRWHSSSVLKCNFYNLSLINKKYMLLTFQMYVVLKQDSVQGMFEAFSRYGVLVYWI